MSESRHRLYEWRMLHRVTAALLACYLGLLGSRAAAGEAAWQPLEAGILAGYLASLYLLSRALERMRLRGDEVLAPLVGLLLGIGLLVKLALLPEPPTWPPSPRWLVYPGALAVLAGSVWVCRNRLHWLDGASWLCGIASSVLLYLLVQHGTHLRGAMFGPGLTTPTEALKPLMVVFLAGFLKRKRTTLELVAFAVLWIVPSALLVQQRDLGMIVILGLLSLSLFYVATGRTRFLLIGLGAAALLAVALFYAARLGSGAAQHGQRRIELWLHPWDDPFGSGHQSLQALFAVRAGSWEGAGLGRGLPRSVPLVESDFVYAALGEWFGWLGCVMLLLAYLAILRRGYRIAALCDEPFRQRLAVGCVTVLAVQTWLNVGGVVRLIPITGITLPFVSHGGSSLVACAVLIGLLLAVGHDVEAGDARRFRWPWERRESPTPEPT